MYASWWSLPWTSDCCSRDLTVRVRKNRGSVLCFYGRWPTFCFPSCSSGATFKTSIFWSLRQPVFSCPMQLPLLSIWGIFCTHDCLWISLKFVGQAVARAEANQAIPAVWIVCGLCNYASTTGSLLRLRLKSSSSTVFSGPESTWLGTKSWLQQNCVFWILAVWPLSLLAWSKDQLHVSWFASRQSLRPCLLGSSRARLPFVQGLSWSVWP